MLGPGPDPDRKCVKNISGSWIGPETEKKKKNYRSCVGPGGVASGPGGVASGPAELPGARRSCVGRV